jgi:hypothetical protein
MISGLYATLISVQDNAVLQFVSSPLLATQFQLDTAGYLYTLPSSLSQNQTFASFSSSRLVANVDSAGGDVDGDGVDLFFNEDEYMQDDASAGGDAEEVVCSVVAAAAAGGNVSKYGDGVLQCMGSSTNDLVWSDQRGTVGMADCAPGACVEARLVVVYA